MVFFYQGAFQVAVLSQCLEAQSRELQSVHKAIASLEAAKLKSEAARAKPSTKTT